MVVTATGHVYMVEFKPDGPAGQVWSLFLSVGWLCALLCSVWKLRLPFVQSSRSRGGRVRAAGRSRLRWCPAAMDVFSPPRSGAVSRGYLDEHVCAGLRGRRFILLPSRSAPQPRSRDTPRCIACWPLEGFAWFLVEGCRRNHRGRVVGPQF